MLGVTAIAVMKSNAVPTMSVKISVKIAKKEKVPASVNAQPVVNMTPLVPGFCYIQLLRKSDSLLC